jgi:hypothetical protein
VTTPTNNPATAEPYVSRIDRRTTLAWLGGAGAVALVGGPVVAQGYGGAPAPAAAGYGTDPDLRKPAAPWPRILTKAQLQTAALLCDFILPAFGDAPAATALGVPDFIDEWVSAPYPDQAADRPIVVAGLNGLEDEARRRHGQDLLHTAPADRDALFAGLTGRPSDPSLAAPHAFFRRFRALTIGAYYTTEAGFRDIGYIGNVAMASYPGPSDAVKAVLDTRLKKLGL